ncbi:MAG: glycosyl hydrolase family 17 [Bacteroidia bacterium]|nr:glycosyl hydrolase family 17 [Bacteroidia bacterium]MBT8270322.1 glycosyl hydrolase family 17 [Bacteroidia bacterium]NNK71365.1 glycosyl hydrolase family 17 [Flavobacteriaceae bacterium]
MKSVLTKIIVVCALLLSVSCNQDKTKKETPIQKDSDLTAKDILGNPEYLAISYGGYRGKSRDIQPTVDQIKEDMKILHAMNIRILRTYNTKLRHATTLLEAITELRKEDPSFEMFVMLGAWIDCENAWTDRPPNHDSEDLEANTAEIERAVNMANKYPDIVKVIAVGNEAMVKWATSYFVQPGIILKWVNHLQNLKSEDKLPEDLWITSSDNFASWGGGDPEYHVEDLNSLIKAVDYISIHTYPMHDTHYNPVFWGVMEDEDQLTELDKIDRSMLRARNYAISQFDSVRNYMKSLEVDKPIHIGETGWASVSDGYYGHKGSRATDEYKEAIFYNHLREWTNENSISCFYFEAFDEPWKDSYNSNGSENHFGLFTVEGYAKYPLWELVDQGVFEGLTRDGNKVLKTYNGDKEELMKEVEVPIPFGAVNAN